MEEAKAAAYYDELTRKGEGAARFKQGLGFSSHSSSDTTTNPTRGSALPSSSSFLSNFVRASSPGKTTATQKKIQLENVQNKLKKKQNSESLSNKVSDNKHESSRERERSSRRRSRSRDRDRDRERKSERQYRSSSRDRERKSERKRRSRSRSYSDEERRRYRSSSRDRADDRDRGRKIERRRRSRSRSSSSNDGRRRQRNSRENHSSRRRRRSSSSPGERKSERGRIDEHKRKFEVRNDKEKNGGIDYCRLINGYAEMTPGERVKAKMKLQLSQTVEKDSAMGVGAGWERFEFNKDAPLEDEEMEVVEDDAVLVKNIGQSFRFSAVEARREEQIKAAHDEAIFGAPVAQRSSLTSNELILEDDGKESKGSAQNVTLMSEKVLAKQNGSWRDRARKLKDG